MVRNRQRCHFEAPSNHCGYTSSTGFLFGPKKRYISLCGLPHVGYGVLSAVLPMHFWFWAQPQRWRVYFHMKHRVSFWLLLMLLEYSKSSKRCLKITYHYMLAQTRQLIQLIKFLNKWEILCFNAFTGLCVREGVLLPPHLVHQLLGFNTLCWIRRVYVCMYI